MFKATWQVCGIVWAKGILLIMLIKTLLKASTAQFPVHFLNYPNNFNWSVY